MKNSYFKDNGFELLLGDSFDVIKQTKSKSIDMIFADPPYFLSNNGITCHSGTMVSVNKASWDKTDMTVNDKLSFNRRWLKKCKRVLKDSGTIFISGTLHNIYIIGVALEMEGYQIINNITWKKLNPPPHLARKAFTHSTETILWARKKGEKYLFNYNQMKQFNLGKQMKDVWEFPLTKKSEKKCGKHPTQKPLDLLRRIILASTTEGHIVLDPFNGSGTTGIAASELKRKYIGIDLEKEYLDLTICRYKGVTHEKKI